jgi:hypothetical protein
LGINFANFRFSQNSQQILFIKVLLFMLFYFLNKVVSSSNRPILH